MELSKSQIVEAKITEWIKNDRICKKLMSDSTLKECKLFAVRIADKYGALINENFNLEAIAEDIPELKTVLQQLRVKASRFTEISVEKLNEKNGINIKPQKPKKIKAESIDNLIDRINKNSVENGGAISPKDEFLLNDGVLEHISVEAVNDTIKANAEMMREAGIKTVFSRHLGPDGCCSWCVDLAGAYSYEDLPEDFWRTHDNCGCWMEYRTERRYDKVSFKRINGYKTKITESL